MLEHLFGSKTRYRLLRTLFQRPEKPFFVRELTRELDTQINAVRRELQLLLEMGLLKELDEPGSGGKRSAGAKKYYALDPTSLIYEEMRALLVKGQLIGEQAFIEALKQKSGEVSLLLLTGRFTGDDRANSDILLVGAVKERTLAKLISDYERESGSVIRYTVMTEQEFRDRRQMMDKFLYSLFEARHMKVVDALV